MYIIKKELQIFVILLTFLKLTKPKESFTYIPK